MSLTDWFSAWRHRRARDYLRRHQDLALAALRLDPALATAAALAAQLQAAGDPQRQSAQYPILNQLGQGARTTIALTLPKVTPFNLRRFCFDNQTDVLTRRGWVPWPDVSMSDVFATVNITTGQAEWQQPDRLYRYRVDGEMVRFLSRDVDALVTPEHKMLGRFRKGRDIWDGKLQCPECSKVFQKATGLGAHRRYIHGISGTWKDVTDSYRYTGWRLVDAQKIERWAQQYTSGVAVFEIPLSAEWTGEFPQGYDPETATVPVECYTSSYRSGPIRSQETRVALADLVAFLGIYIAEGSSEGSYAGMDTSITSAIPHYQQAAAALPPISPYRPKSYLVRIAQTGNGKRAEIESLLARLPWCFRSDKDERGFTAHNQYLWKMVYPLGNTYTKYVPLWVKNLPPDYLTIFTDWAMKGDGCVTEDGCHIYFTVSQRLADDMQEIYQRAGSSARVTKRPSRGSVPWGVSDGRSAPMYIVHEKQRAVSGVGARHITREEYHGDVYCADIPNKTVYIRRNGKAYWCGRSEYPPARRAIRAIKEPILQQAWCIEPVPNPDVSRHDTHTPTSDQVRRIKGLTACLQRPNSDEGWRVWASQVFEDMLVGGYGASEVRLTGNVERPIYLWAVDGQSVRINTTWQPGEATFRYAQSLGYAGLSVGTHEVAQLRDDEMLYFRLDPRSNTPFGLGYLETAFTAINAFIGAFEYAERRASNATPMFALFLGENVTLDQARRWQQYWQQTVEGYGAVPILGGGRAPQVLPFVGQGEDQLWLKWQEFTLRIVAMSFGISNMTLNLERDVNRSTSQQLDAKDWETVSPVADAFADHLTSKLLWQILGWTDLQFRWLIRDTDEKRQAEILREQWESDAITVNEQRQVWKRPPLPGPLGELTKTAYEEVLKSQAQAASLPEPSGGPPDREPENVSESDEETDDDAVSDDSLGTAAWAAYFDLLDSRDGPTP